MDHYKCTTILYRVLSRSNHIISMLCLDGDFNVSGAGYHIQYLLPGKDAKLVRHSHDVAVTAWFDYFLRMVKLDTDGCFALGDLVRGDACDTDQGYGTGR